MTGGHVLYSFCGASSDTQYWDSIRRFANDLNGISTHVLNIDFPHVARARSYTDMRVCIRYATRGLAAAAGLWQLAALVCIPPFDQPPHHRKEKRISWRSADTGQSSELGESRVGTRSRTSLLQASRTIIPSIVVFAARPVCVPRCRCSQTTHSFM